VKTYQGKACRGAKNPPTTQIEPLAVRECSRGECQQADVDGQLLIARVKLKYMGLKKGTWQERVDRAYEQSV
jgi:hypothetical protein